MKLKGKQLKRVRRCRLLVLKRDVAKLKQKISKLGIRGYVDLKIQMTQPLPTTIDVDAWGRERNAMALCKLLGVPFEMYQASQIDNK